MASAMLIYVAVVVVIAVLVNRAVFRAKRRISHAERGRPSRVDLYRLAKSMEEDGYDVDYELLGIGDLAGEPTPYVLYRNDVVNDSEYASLLYAQNQARREEDAKRRKKIEEMMAELDRKGAPYSVVRSYQGGIISIQLEGN